VTAPAPAPSPSSNVRQFHVSASSAPVWGRVICTARNHHFIVDGPVYNGCPGEEIVPPEMFLLAVASCGVELMHVIARDENIPLVNAAINVEGLVDRERQPRTDVTLFNLVRLNVILKGITRAQGKTLVDGFSKRCPIFGSIKVAALDTQVEYEVE
jgi:uncharacterized OsmC-like protein